MGVEQRRFQRIPESFRLQCRRLGSLAETWRRVATLDLSAVGASFDTEELYDPSDTLDIRIDLPNFRVPLLLHGRVVRSRPRPGGAMECAVEFVDMTPEQQGAIDELVQFLSKRIE